MAAVVLWPDVAVNGELVVVMLVLISEGLQFEAPVPSVVNANASIV